jgi:glycosyltransferase involved in cell wall biosynthesis
MSDLNADLLSPALPDTVTRRDSEAWAQGADRAGSIVEAGAGIPAAAPSPSVAPIRVAHVFKVFIPEVNGGIPEIIRLLAAGLVHRCRSEVLVSRVRGPGVSEIVEGIVVHRAGALKSVWSMPISPSFPLLVWGAAKRVDVVDYHAPFPLVDLAVSLWFPRRTALIVHWHSEIIAQRRMLPIVGPFIRRTLRRADRIVVSTPAMIEQSPFLKPFADKCVVIPYGIDVDYWKDLDTGDIARIAELRALHPRLIVATGRLVPYKGFGVLIDAMRDVDGTLVIVGTGPLESALRRQIEEAGLGDRVHLVGYLERPELRCLLHACRVFTMPSVEESETFGIAQVEAMACGKPVVNTRLLTGVPWVARDGSEAMTVPPGSADALAKALTHVLDHEEEAAAMGARSLQRAETTFSFTTFLNATLTTISDALRERRSS